VLFFPIQQELDCISESGQILGKIKFDDPNGVHVFYRIDDSVVISSADDAAIAERLAGLDSGKYSIPMQDDD
jgi:hypothetical protein|tara:strand:- start:461 stop:676 length:216 start_codon:yes stop_codon:yes gene_type:complete